MVSNQKHGQNTGLTGTNIGICQGKRMICGQSIRKRAKGKEIN